jgi:hypothetical protein
MAAAVALLQQADALMEGPVPLLPSEPTSQNGEADVAEESDREQDLEYTSSDSDKLESGGTAANGIYNTQDEVDPLATTCLRILMAAYVTRE